MKKYVSILLLLLPVVVMAQSAKKFSFYIHAGHRSAPYIKEAGHAQGIHSETETHDHKCIVFNTGIQYQLSDKWRTGISFTYDHFGTKHRSLELSNISYMGRLDRLWKNTDRMTLYSGAGVGIRKVREFDNEVETDRKTVLAYQVNAIGINYRLFNRFYADLNAGWGVTGILSGGISYRF